MWAKAEESLAMLHATVKALEAIRSFLPTPAHQAADALVAIEAILDALAKGFAGHVKAADVTASIEALRDGIRSNDQGADADLDAKFR